MYRFPSLGKSFDVRRKCFTHKMYANVKYFVKM